MELFIYALLLLVFFVGILYWGSRVAAHDGCYDTVNPSGFMPTPQQSAKNKRAINKAKKLAGLANPSWRASDGWPRTNVVTAARDFAGGEKLLVQLRGKRIKSGPMAERNLA